MPHMVYVMLLIAVPVVKCMNLLRIASWLVMGYWVHSVQHCCLCDGMLCIVALC